MEYLIDLNLPTNFFLHQREEYEHVYDLNVHWTDVQLWKYAKEHAMTIITRQVNYSYQVFLDDRAPHVIVVGFQGLSLEECNSKFSRNWQEIRTLSESYKLVQVFNDKIQAIAKVDGYNSFKL